MSLTKSMKDINESRLVSKFNYITHTHTHIFETLLLLNLIKQFSFTQLKINNSVLKIPNINNAC